MMRHGDRFSNPFQYAVASYYKPAAVLEGLRAALGDSTFKAAFREYGRRWAWKHPTPRDFFNTVSGVAGRDLDWFWRSWYHETWRLDQALDEVVVAGDSARVTVTSKGKVPMPVLLVARGTAGDSTTATIPVEAFLNGARTATVTMPVPKGVVRVEIDPGRRLPDAEPLNQSWPKGGAR
jgi:aminopeptidase N